jgi:beta-glucosidase
MSDPPDPTDESVPQADRIDALVDEMTVPEKAGQCCGTYAGDLHDSQSVADVRDLIDSHHLGAVSPFGWLGAPVADPTDAARAANDLQRHAVEETRLGVPLLVPVDAVHGHAYVHGTTVFPSALGVAATFDPSLAREAARVTAREMRATGATTNYGPTCDVVRDPRWGRTLETYGESPRLVADLAAAAVRGFQGGDGGVGDADPAVAATAKHFPAYGGPVRGEDAAPVEATASTLRRTFLPPFAAAVDAGAASVMPCYNSVDDRPAHGSRRFLGDLLRERFGFAGVVASDWNGVRQLAEDHHTAPGLRGAVREAFAAGVDVASVGGPSHAEALAALVDDGDLSESVLDAHVRRVLSLKFDLGLFADPYVDVDAAAGAVGTADAREVARRTARRAQTLLANDGTLPLDPGADLLVTGPNADDRAATLGGWSVADPRTEDVTTVRDGLSARGDGSVTYVPVASGGPETDRDGVGAARAAARDADAAVVVLGEPWYIHEFGPREMVRGGDGEGDGGPPPESFPSRLSLRLPEDQRALLRSVAATGTPTVAVLVAGRPLSTPQVAETAGALLLSYCPGSEGGAAVADVLFGAEPGGRLPVSVPRSEGHLPTRHDHRPNPRPIGEGAHPPAYDPLFPFGHGESYADPAVVALSLSTPDGEELADGDALPPDAGLRVAVRVENRADRAGEAVLQAYLRPEWTRRARPVRTLVGYERCSLAAGESRTVTLSPSRSALGDPAASPPGTTPTLAPGRYTLAAGLSATDLPVAASFAVPESAAGTD